MSLHVAPKAVTQNGYQRHRMRRHLVIDNSRWPVGSTDSSGTSDFSCLPADLCPYLTVRFTKQSLYTLPCQQTGMNTKSRP